MDIIGNVLNEDDVLLMPDSCILALGKLLDVGLATILKNYISNPDANQLTVTKVKQLIGADIDSFTYHLELETDGSIEFVQKLNIVVLPYNIVNLEEYKRILKHVEDNKHRLKGTIPPRNREDYLEFLEEIKQFESSTRGLHYTNLVRRIKDNSAWFYRPHEQPRTTSAAVIIGKSRRIAEAYQGLLYAEYCGKNGINDYLRREF